MPNSTVFRTVSRKCANCGGEGLLPGNDHRGMPRECRACNGEGYYTERVRVENVTVELRRAA